MARRVKATIDPQQEKTNFNLYEITSQRHIQNTSGKIYEKSTYKYDEKGNRVEEVRHDASGKLTLRPRGLTGSGHHVAAFDELEEIEPKLRGHPDVLEVHWRIYEMADNWDYCIEIGNALVKMKPDDLSCWIRRSYVLHKLERTQEAYDELKPALDKFKGEWLLQYNLACYTCLLGNVEEARKLIEEAIELGGDVVRLRALDDEHLIRVWAGP